MADAPKYATGGIIPVPEGAREDEVPVRLRCEFIITPAMARRYGLAALDRLNDNEVTK
jgi:hypothetical protein